MSFPENIGAQPYHPQQVPLGMDEELRRYLYDEFTTIQFVLAGFPAAAAYGAVTVDPGPAPDQPLNPPPAQLITGWDTTQPQRPNRMGTNLVDSSLEPFESGVYLVQVQIAFELDSGRLYVFRIFVNGVATGIDGGIDPSQQTDSAVITLIGLLTLAPGDIVQLFGEAEALGAPHTFIMRDATMLLTRVSEFSHDDG